MTLGIREPYDPDLYVQLVTVNDIKVATDRAVPEGFFSS
jgi:hypothetical protein